MAWPLHFRLSILPLAAVLMLAGSGAYSSCGATSWPGPLPYVSQFLTSLACVAFSPALQASSQASRNVIAVIGYAFGLSELIVLKRRSSGGVTPWAAADVAWSDGSTYWPDLFLIAAVVKLFCSAYACST